MKLDAELAKQLRIPTAGMTEIRLGVMTKTGHYDYPDEVRAFLENGKLPNGHTGSDTSVYFIQREDGYVAVGLLSEKLPSVNNIGIVSDPSINGHLESGVAAEFIVAKVDPVCLRHRDKLFLNSHYGPLAFLADHHPDPYSSELAFLKMAEVFMATESEEEKAAFRKAYEERAAKLGINNAS